MQSFDRKAAADQLSKNLNLLVNQEKLTTTKFKIAMPCVAGKTKRHFDSYSLI